MTRLNYTSVWAHSINNPSKCEASLVQFNLPGITAGILVELEPWTENEWTEPETIVRFQRLKYKQVWPVTFAMQFWQKSLSSNFDKNPFTN